MFDEKRYKPMVCPICNEFYFSERNHEFSDDEFGRMDKEFWDEIGQYEKVYCHKCGWKYDIDQFENPDLKVGENTMSLNEYKELYKAKVEEDPNYDYTEDDYVPIPHKCPVCGKYEFEDEGCFDICPYCGWEDDNIQGNDLNYEGGANELSLNEYKKQYEKLIAENPKYVWGKQFK